jgi:hypothetical protein
LLGNSWCEKDTGKHSGKAAAVVLNRSSSEDGERMLITTRLLGGYATAENKRWYIDGKISL